jgi:hypothetical protein
LKNACLCGMRQHAHLQPYRAERDPRLASMPCWCCGRWVSRPLWTVSDWSEDQYVAAGRPQCMRVEGGAVLVAECGPCRPQVFFILIYCKKSKARKQRQTCNMPTSAYFNGFIGCCIQPTLCCDSSCFTGC